MSANFLLDENIPYALIDLLERKGFSVDHLKKWARLGSRMERFTSWPKKHRPGF